MRLLDWAEAVLVRALIALLRALPPAAASDLGGAVASRLGPLLPVSRVADGNLRHAYPEKDADWRSQVVRGVWENLGRTAGELPHLAALRRTPAGPGWEIEGEEHLRKLAASGGPAILVSGHIGNWEVLPVAADACGLPMSSFYRPAKNRRVDAAINALRLGAVRPGITMFPKSTSGAIAARAHLGRGGFLGILQDQKTNEGIAAPLFGRDAMTATAAASFALHFRCPLIVGHVRRIGPARLRVVVGAPMALPDTGERARDVRLLTAALNAELEQRIRTLPAGWLWLHRRWPNHGS